MTHKRRKMAQFTQVSRWLCLLLALFFSSSLGSNEELQKALEKAAGIYKNPTLTAKHNLQKTVLVTGCNYGFLNHLFNFKCFLDRLEMKFLVISFDGKAYSYLRNNTDIPTYNMAVGGGIGGIGVGGGYGGEVTSESTEFRSKQFNMITARKKEAVYRIMSLGYDVLFSDTDVALLRDPVPYMLWRNVDYVHSLNQACVVGLKFNLFKSKAEGNTGFYFARANAKTTKLWMDAYAAAPKHPRLDDQAVFWKVLRLSKDPTILPLEKCRHYDEGSATGAGVRSLVTCVLDSCVFSSGMLSRMYVPEQTYETLQSSLQSMNESAVAIHANYMSGNRKKAQRMLEYNLWLLQDGMTLDSAGASSSGAGEYYNMKCREYVPYAGNASSIATSASIAATAGKV